MNESLVKYLAGLLDADGSLSFSFKADSNREGLCFVGLRITLASSEAVDKNGFVDLLPTLTGMGTVSRYGAQSQFKVWNISKRADLEMLLPRLIKHMVIKARHWDWLLEQWRDLRTNPRLPGQAGKCDGRTVTPEERAALIASVKESRRERVGPMKPKNHPTWAWLAGYLDGDGCYHYRFHRPQWLIAVSATAHKDDASVLEFLHKAFGGYILEAKPNVKVWHRALGYANRSLALSILPKLAKHSRLKRHKIDAIIHHHQQRLSVQGVKTQAIV